MSEPTVRPIWVPEDARQAARDAARHVGVRGIRDAEALLYLDRLESSPPIVPPPGFLASTSPQQVRHRAPEPVGMRPRRALLIGRVLIGTAVVLLVLVVAALWVLGVPQ